MRTTAKRRTRGNFYAYAIRLNEENGKRYADEVGWQLKTLAEAVKRIDERGSKGDVHYWSESAQQRYRVAERDADGSWWSINRFNGERSPLDCTNDRSRTATVKG